ncbi:MAG: class I SAM-dependent RNA methyltransferase [Myxococcales bacterium]|nr:class I SAM-dependent RNA methyltransferase [Myxococcales bacterium]
MHNTTTVRFFGLAFGGEAVGREQDGPHRGRIVFAFGAAPGDLARILLVRVHKGHAFGTLVEILEPGDRVSPFCPAFGRCGGCQWQHIPLHIQHREKAELVRRGFRGLLADAQEVVVTCGESVSYRSRVRLALRLGGNNPGCGFRGLSNRDVVTVDGCPVAVPALSQGIADLTQQLRTLTQVSASGTAVLMAGDTGLTASIRAPLAPGLASQLAHNLAMRPGWVGACVDDGRSVCVAGDPAVEWVSHEAGMPWVLTVDADGFAQANRQITKTIIEDLLAALEPSAVSKTSVLELFCGAGTFTLPLLSRFSSVMALEGSAKAVERLRANSRRAGMDHLVSAVVDLSTPAQLVPYLNKRPETIVLDPPREGAQPLMTSLGQSGASTIVYISCDHTTAARDIRILAACGYGVATLKVYDMFPHTSHCETLIVLRKRVAFETST